MIETRQIILMRTDLYMGVGKMIAQGAHASQGALLNQQKRITDKRINLDDSEKIIDENLKNWNETGNTKIVVQVKSEEKLLNLVKKAQDMGINSYLVTDEGRTVFEEPTITCACLGVDTKENLDKITKRLRLLV